jgi:hypothetical protein
VISPSQGLYLHIEQHKYEQKNTDIRALSGIRTHDPSFREIEDNSCLRRRDHCDRLVSSNRWHVNYQVANATATTTVTSSICTEKRLFLIIQHSSTQLRSYIVVHFLKPPCFTSLNSIVFYRNCLNNIKDFKCFNIFIKTTPPEGRAPHFGNLCSKH